MYYECNSLMKVGLMRTFMLNDLATRISIIRDNYDVCDIYIIYVFFIRIIHMYCFLVFILVCFLTFCFIF